ncbi:hypothetical protein ACVIYH_006812 [Bradyrhizobium diazoefficiens]
MKQLTLNGHVRQKLSSVGGFVALANECYGAWPPDIVDSLAGIAKLERAESDRIAWLLHDAKRPAELPLQVDADLPLEHPLDSDWRFQTRERGRLVERLMSRLAPSDKVLAICAPTIVLEAARRGIGWRMIVGTRPNDPIIAALQGLVPDAQYVPLDDLENIEAAAGIIDPPWQDQIAAPLIQRLCAGVRIGARVLITGPDRFTAANSVVSLKSRYGSPRWLGLKADCLPFRIRYKTPRFEARALLASGIANVPPAWRTGLVHSYQKMIEVHPDLDLDQRSDWSEVSLGEHRVWYRAEFNGLKADVNVSSSVSSVSPLRRTATMWTSGNSVVTGGSKIDLESLFRRSSQKVGDDLRERLLRVEQGSCWQSQGPLDGRLAAQAPRCEDSHGVVTTGLQ